MKKTVRGSKCLSCDAVPPPGLLSSLGGCAHVTCHEHLPELPRADCQNCDRVWTEWFGREAECMICAKGLASTISMPRECGHTFCTPCLTPAPGVQSLVCPVCRRVSDGVVEFIRTGDRLQLRSQIVTTCHVMPDRPFPFARTVVDLSSYVHVHIYI
jgi:hypothetical protein